MRGQTACERGMALVLALVALVVIGGLVSSGLLVALYEQRSGRNSLRLEQAFAAAEEGIHAQIADWNSEAHAELSFGESNTFDGEVADGTGWYRGAVTRLSPLLFLVSAEGFTRGDQARQRVGILVTLRPLEFSPGAAVATQGWVRLSGRTRISGHDTPPRGWACPAVTPSVPAIRLPPPDLARVSVEECEGRCLDGNPVLLPDATIASALLAPGGVSFDALKARATKILVGGGLRVAPAAAGRTCRTAAPGNWGDPFNPQGPCGQYAPVVYSTGPLDIRGGYGQGLLIVDGDLSIQGAFRFYGLIVVRGRLQTTGIGTLLQGAVLISNAARETTWVGGTTAIQYSSCALRRALAASGRATPLAGRSWIQLY